MCVQIRQLQEKRTKASREIIHLAAEAKLAVAMNNKAVAAYVTFDDEMAAIEARVGWWGVLPCPLVGRYFGAVVALALGR